MCCVFLTWIGLSEISWVLFFLPWPACPRYLVLCFFYLDWVVRDIMFCVSYLYRVVLDIMLCFSYLDRVVLDILGWIVPHWRHLLTTETIESDRSNTTNIVKHLLGILGMRNIIKIKERRQLSFKIWRENLDNLNNSDRYTGLSIYKSVGWEGITVNWKLILNYNNSI